MHVFVTGATGWVGSAVVDDLIEAGHRVTGLARSPEKGALLAKTGAKVLRATLEDLKVLTVAAHEADAVIHTAFQHDFSSFQACCELDRRVIAALGGALAGSDRPLLVTSGLAGLPRGATEADQPRPGSPRVSEATARGLADAGLRAATIRLAPSVHGLGDHGFIPILARLAREKGVSAYVDGVDNAWSGVHRLDAARLYRLALEEGAKQSVYHAVTDEEVSFKAIAEVIGRQLRLPVEPRGPEHFGWFANFAGADMAASSQRTRDLLGWQPAGSSLLADLGQAAYYGAPLPER
jgi:nucleoside-diphosphate-sugar epimerase